VRLRSKLMRGRLSELCRHFDWMNGTEQHPDETASNLAWKLVAWLIAVWAAQWPASREVACTAFVALYTTWVLRHNGTLLLGEWKRPLVRPPLDVDFEPGVVPFVVLAYQRTGSNMLIRNHLNKHPQVHMHFELFNEKAIYTQSKPGEVKEGAIKDVAALRARDQNSAAFLAKTIREGAAVADCAAVGFKWFPEHVRGTAFLERLLANVRIRKVVLRRENRLACVTSIIRASVTGRWINAVLTHCVYITPPDFQLFTECYDAYYSFLRDRLAGQDHVELTYESLVAEPELALRPVYELLQLRPQKSAPVLDGDLKPQSSDALCDALDNFGELRAAFATTDRASDFETAI
jgi:LPS sulfotransferase NodH